MAEKICNQCMKLIKKPEHPVMITIKFGGDTHISTIYMHKECYSKAKKGGLR